MKIVIDGSQIGSEAEFHRVLAEKLRLPGHYGKNLDAMWDVLSTDVERPVNLCWENSELSAAALGPVFDKIVQVLERVRDQDESWGLPDRFDFSLC